MSTTYRRRARGAAPAGNAAARPAGDPHWYKDAVIYELHVRAFYDSDGDGIGDFRGLTEKLDYLQSLGVTAVWLLPFYPSPLKDDGYDISSYTEVHGSYGKLREFEAFLREAHARGLRVITELVVNHTSDQHAWFQKARRAKPGSKAREFYVWSDTPDRYRDARIVFKDFESSNWAWDSVAKAYYWHRFYSHQPDLNYENPAVRRALLRAVDFWMRMGIDGLRLDAVPYLYEREGTMCENLPETHAFLKDLRRHVDGRFQERMLLAEANQWPEDAAAYFGEGDECHMAFHFPLMPRLFMAIRMEDRYPILDMLEQTPSIPQSCQWGIFLRNHDELTLEMVTDEERDYMYRVYAHDPQARINLGIRRRLGPLLGNHHRRIELMNGLLFSLPGTPIIYYGDEIGMGDNIYLGDRNGVRTPMQWSPDRNAGFSRCNPQRLYLPVIIDSEYHYESVNVEAQQNNPHSRLWWTRRLVALRRQYKAFSRGDLVVISPENRGVLAFVRRHEEERILVIANLSRFVEYAELNLAAYKGMVPVELFGRKEFPPIGEAPYFLTLGPHSFYWFALQPNRGAAPRAWADPGGAGPAPMVAAAPWREVLKGPERPALERALGSYVRERRWFGGKARRLKSTGISHAVEIPPDGVVLFVRVDYAEGEPETYLLPLARATGERAARVASEYPGAVVARAVDAEGAPAGIVFDALVDPGFSGRLLEMVARKRHVVGVDGRLLAVRTRAFRKVMGGGEAPSEPVPMGAEQRNTSVTFGDRLILKVFRRLDPGPNPDLELGRFLTERGFPHIPAVTGALEFHPEAAEPMTVAVAQAFVPNQGDGWQYTLHHMGAFHERALAGQPEIRKAPVPKGSLLDLAAEPPPPLVFEMTAPYLEAARLLGIRTAEMHAVLASNTADPAFAPEPFSTLYQRSVYQSMRSLAGQVLPLLRRRADTLPKAAAGDARRVLEGQPEILRRLRALLDRRISGLRTRIHGDYHLGQVLHTGKDFVIIDFEGEPARPIAERRLKRSPLRDVAGMLRSFHCAAHFALLSPGGAGALTPEAGRSLLPWAQFWYRWVGAAFLGAYLEAASTGAFLPRTSAETRVLIDAFLLEKAIYEIGYELNNRPDWVRIPLQGVLELIGPR